MLNDERIRHTLSSAIEGFDPNRVNPVSYDVILHHMIQHERHPLMTRFLDVKYALHTPDYTLPELQSSPNRFRTVNLNDTAFYLRPGHFVLAATEEIFHLPNDIAANFLLKSTTARLGYGHHLAGLADPGWCGSRLTLELFNPTRTPLLLRTGMKIGQMVFHKVETPLMSYAEVGHYNGDLGAQAAKTSLY